jgi:hypothetical protein
VQIPDNVLTVLEKEFASSEYGSLTIKWVANGTFYEIITERKQRVCKDEIFKKSEFKQG